jgi:hypothetical protein
VAVGLLGLQLVRVTRVFKLQLGLLWLFRVTVRVKRGIILLGLFGLLGLQLELIELH